MDILIPRILKRFMGRAIFYNSENLFGGKLAPCLRRGKPGLSPGALKSFPHRGTASSASFSSNPDIIFIFWTAWPDAPFTRLSIAEIITTLFVLLSALRPTLRQLEPRTSFLLGKVSSLQTLIKGSFL